MLAAPLWEESVYVKACLGIKRVQIKKNTADVRRAQLSEKCQSLDQLFLPRRSQFLAACLHLALERRQPHGGQRNQLRRGGHEHNSTHGAHITSRGPAAAPLGSWLMRKYYR